MHKAKQTLQISPQTGRLFFPVRLKIKKLRLRLYQVKNTSSFKNTEVKQLVATVST